MKIKSDLLELRNTAFEVEDQAELSVCKHQDRRHTLQSQL